MASPDWEYKRPQGYNAAPLPAAYEKRLRYILASRSVGETDAERLIAACRFAVAVYRTDSSRNDGAPSSASRVRALESIAADARSLSKKLYSCGGADLELSAALMSLGVNSSLDWDVHKKLLDLAAGCDNAAASLKPTVKRGGSQLNARDGSLGSLALEYFIIFGTRPTASHSDEYATTSLFVDLCRVTLAFCEGSEPSLQAAKKAAERAIKNSEFRAVGTD